MFVSPGSNVTDIQEETLARAPITRDATRESGLDRIHMTPDVYSGLYMWRFERLVHSGVHDRVISYTII